MTAGSVVVPRIIPIRFPHNGKAKHDVDTSTPIEIKSDSPDVIIYYTLDGRKPEVFQRPSCKSSSTLRYTKPIYLPEGRVSVKAVAVTSDGRESATVTKLFLVTLNESMPKMENEVNIGEQQNLSLKEAGEVWSAETKIPVVPTHKLSVPGMEELADRSFGGTRFLNSRLGPRSHAVEHSASQRPQPLNTDLKRISLHNLTNTQASRILRETDFLRCAKCLCHRPSDPFARFCLQCGTAVPPVPGQRLPPSEGGQMAVCVFCKGLVPINTPSCVICEASITPQLQPQASIRLQDKAVCSLCGTGNPRHILYCVTCENPLPQPATALRLIAPPPPSREHKMVTCSKCKRANHYDARFCDWCGSKPRHTITYVMCSHCGASNHPYASYCGSCGLFLEGPLRCPDTTCSAGGAEELNEESQPSEGVTWQPVPVPPVYVPPPTADAQTQTVGLFYPSAAELLRKQQESAVEQSRQETMRDRRPLLTAVSPGRGYWRKQLDHVCAHLRSYAQNNTDFRTLIGEPCMGRMISAIIEEDNYEVSLRINFALAKEKKQVSSETGSAATYSPQPGQDFSSITEGSTTGPSNTRNDFSSITEGSTTGPSNTRNDFSSITEGSTTGPSNSRKEGERAVVLRKLPKQSLAYEMTPKPPVKHSQLLSELGPEGRGQISVVQQLLDEGADPSCQDSNGRPVLLVAVMNGHHDALPVLVQKGADINQQSGPMNNTALHEAAARGSKGLLCAEVLLGLNASLKKNTQSHTAYDLALTSGCDEMVALLAAKVGQGVLGRLGRSTGKLSLDGF